MIKIVVTSDNHLNKFYKKMNPEQLRKRREFLRRAFKEVVDFAINEKVDLFFQAGDLFDMPNPRNIELIFVMEQFAHLKENGIDVFTVAGTHDSLISADEDSYPIRIFEKAGFVKAFTKLQELEPVIWEKNGSEKVLISGISTDMRLRDREPDPLQLLKLKNSYDGDFIKILLLHYSVEKFAHPKAREPQIKESSLNQLPFDLYIIGHLHTNRHYDLSNKKVIIPGATERVNFGEEENDTGFYFIVIEKNKVSKVEYIKTNSQPMKSIEVIIENRTNEDPTEMIINEIKKQSSKEQLLRCILKGKISSDLFTQINREKIMDIGNNLNFFFDLDTQNLDIYDLSTTSISSEDLSIRKVLETIHNELLSQSQEQDKEILKESYEWVSSFLEKSDNFGDLL